MKTINHTNAKQITARLLANSFGVFCLTLLTMFIMGCGSSTSSTNENAENETDTRPSSENKSNDDNSSTGTSQSDNGSRSFLCR